MQGLVNRLTNHNKKTFPVMSLRDSNHKLVCFVTVCFGENDNYSHEYEICIYLHHIGDTQNQIQHDEIYMSKLKVRTD